MGGFRVGYNYLFLVPPIYVLPQGERPNWIQFSIHTENHQKNIQADKWLLLCFFILTSVNWCDVFVIFLSCTE